MTSDHRPDRIWVEETEVAYPTFATQGRIIQGKAAEKQGSVVVSCESEREPLVVMTPWRAGKRLEEEKRRW